MLITFSYFLWFSGTPAVVLWLAALFQFCLKNWSLSASLSGRQDFCVKSLHIQGRLLIEHRSGSNLAFLSMTCKYCWWTEHLAKITCCEQHKKMDRLHPHLSKFESISCSFFAAESASLWLMVAWLLQQMFALQINGLNETWMFFLFMKSPSRTCPDVLRSFLLPC